MYNDAHVHEDDLELYRSGHLEPQYILAIELHLSGCQDCRERLQKCLGPEMAETAWQ
jgi:hypothetical protein